MPDATPGQWQSTWLRSTRLLSLALTTLSLVLVAAASGSRSPALASGSSGTGTSGSIGDALSPSTAEQMALVEHLRQQGAIFYGAWWCPHCFHQKNLFGTEAGRRLPYVECDKDQAGRERCQAAKIRAFPTWDLNGERREGLLTIEELEVWSGFKAKGGTGSR
jgi:glutaredoxin